MSFRKIALIACILIISLFTNAQSDNQLYGDFSPCSPGCYTYLFQDSLYPLEFWLENFQEPFVGSHNYTPLYPNQGSTLAGYEICFQGIGTYGFLSFWYDNNGTTGIDTFYVNVGQSSNYVDIIEVDPCEPDRFIACKGSTVTYELTIDEPLEGSWIIYGANSFSSNGNTVTVTWGEEDFGNLYFESSDPCYFVGEQGVKLIEKPESEFLIENQKNKYCIGEDIFLLNESEGATEFLWDFGDGTTSNAIQPVKSYTQSGNFVITLMAFNDCKCSSIYSIEVNIDELYMPAIDCRSTICEDTRVTYTSSDDCGVFNWTISGNGQIVEGGSINDNYITVQWGKGPEGIITLDVASCSMDVCPTPAQFRIPIISDQVIIEGNLIPCVGSTETYNIIDFGATDYEWIVDGGDIITGHHSNTIIVKWNSTTGGRIDLNFNNCYLECGGSTFSDIIITDGFALTGETKFCSNSPIEHTAISQSSGSPVIVDWEIKGITQQTGDHFSYSDESMAGTYTLYSYAENYCNLSDSVSVVVTEQTEMPDSITGEFAICTGNSYQYTVHTQLNNTTTKWTFHDGNVATELYGNPVIYAWNSIGPYQIQVAHKENNGDYCFSDFIEQNVEEVNELNLTGNEEICVDEIGEYEAKSYDGLEYEWSVSPVDAGIILTNPDKNNIRVQWAKPGNHSIVLEACGKNETIQVNVMPKPEFIVNYESKLCYNKTAITNLDKSFSTYEWSDENGTFISDLPTPELAPGSYQIKIKDDRGCSNLEYFTIEELPRPDVYVSTPDSTGICLDSTFNYPTLYAVNSTEGYAYEWYNGGIALGNNTHTLSTDSLGNYKVLVTDNNGCTAFSNTVRVFEYCGKCIGGPSTGTTCNYPQDCESNEGSISFDYELTENCRRIKFINNSNNVTPGSFIWNFEDFQSGTKNTSTDAEPIHEFTNAGFYVVSLRGEVSDANNPGQFCEAWIANVITIPIKASFESISDCPGSPIEFIDRSTFIPGFTITSYEWDFGDPASGTQNTSSLPNPTHIYALSGTYDVRLVTGNGGCTDTFNAQVVVYDLPEGEIEFTESMCEDIPVASDIIPYNNVVKTTWNFGDISSGDQNLSKVFPAYHGYTDPGIYEVTAELESIFGCTNKIQKNIQIHKNDLNGEIISSNGNPICEGTTTALTAPSANSYEWSTEEKSGSITTAYSDIYTVTITDNNLCKFIPDPIALNLIPSPRSNVFVEVYDEFSSEIKEGLSINICEGQKFRIIAIDNPDHSFQWNTGTTSAVYDYYQENGSDIPQGNYTYNVVITDNTSGCAYQSEDIEVIVLPNPQNLAISSSTSGVLCGGITHTLSVQSPDPALTYIWSNGHIGSSIATNTPGIYNVEATNSDGCSSSSNYLTVEPGPDIDNVPSGCLTRCNPDTICMPEINGAVQYQWYFNGNEIDASQNGTIPELIINQEGVYELQVTDILGCKNTSSPLVLTLEEALGDFLGNVYFDLDGSGDISAGDTLMQDIKIELSNGLYTNSGDNGNFIIPHISGGTFIVDIDTAGLGGIKVLTGPEEITITTCDEIISADFLLTSDCESMNLGIKNYHLCPNEAISEAGQTFDSEGVYDLLVPNTNGCMDSLTLIITQSEATNISTSTTNICKGQGLGALNITTELASNFTYILNGSITNSTGLFTDLPAGVYTIQVIDTKGCIVSEGAETISEVPVMDLGLEEVHLCSEEEVSIGGFTYDSPIEFTNWVPNSEGCLDSQKVIITQSPRIPGDVVGIEPCENSSNGSIGIELESTSNMLTYVLNNGLISNIEGQFEGLSSDQYSIHVLDEFGCSVFESDYTLESIPQLEYEIIEPEWDCELGIKNASVIFPDGQGNLAQVEWKNGRIGQANNAADQGWFHVIISNACESITEEFYVEPQYQKVDIAMPNIFSPNQDGVNEDFGIIEEQLTNPTINTFFISDRMGRIVYNYTGSNTTKWNGTYHSGDYLPVGVYFYYIELEHDVCGKRRRETLSGDVTIIR